VEGSRRSTRELFFIADIGSCLWQFRCQFALACQYSHIQVTCVDHPEVLQVARDLAERFKIENQAQYVAGDLHSLEFEEQIYDIVLLGNVTNFFTEQQNIALFKKIYR